MNISFICVHMCICPHCSGIGVRNFKHNKCAIPALSPFLGLWRSAGGTVKEKTCIISYNNVIKITNERLTQSLCK